MAEDSEFQDTVPNGVGAPGRSAGPWVPPSLDTMQGMLPQYEFLAVLGRGGMGVVYKSRQISLDRQVAIKVLPGDLIDDEDVNFVQRFKQEARTMARMNHPAIVSVFDFGETSNGLLYFVMEFVDGTDVSRMIVGNGPLPSPHALAITAHVCDALAYAHSHGVVHRDIKPANVLINMEGQVKVADFGLAKASDSKEAGLTKTNVAMGTPDFVAPESLITGAPIDGRADLYSIGVMLYQMLTGELPRGMWSMPSCKVGADPRFDAIIARAMQTDREMRYQTAHEVRSDLDRILTMPIVKAGGQGRVAVPKQAIVRQPRPTGQRPAPSSGSLLPPPPKKKKKSAAGLLIGTLAVLFALSAVAFLVWSSRKATEENAAAEAEAAAFAEASPELPDAAEGKPDPAAPPAEREKKVRMQPPQPNQLFAAAGRSYRLIQDEMTWDQARAKAESMGGHLLTINSKAEEDWIKRTFRPFMHPEDLLFVGAQRTSVGGPWEWITGEPFNHKGWGPGWPDGDRWDRMVAVLHPFLDGPALDDVESSRKSIFVVEWDKHGTAAQGVALQEPTNLLDQADLVRNAIKGEWKKITSGVEVQKASGPSLLEFNFTPPEEYDYIVEFTSRVEGSHVNQYLSAQGYALAWKFNFGGGKGLDGFDLVDEKSPNRKDDKFTDKDKGRKVLRPGQRYRSEIQVRKKGLRVLVDGEEIVNWQGDFKRLSVENGSKLHDPQHLGIGSSGRSVVFNRVEVREVKTPANAPSTLGAVALSLTPPAVAPSAIVDKPVDVPQDPRLIQLETGFQARYQTDAVKAYNLAVTSLNQNYVNTGITRARAAAQARGDLDEVSALDAEKQLIEKGEPLPSTDAEGLPASLLQLRKTYRESMAKYAADRDSKTTSLYTIYVKALDDYVVELTKANRIDDAQKVRQLRGEIAQRGEKK